MRRVISLFKVTNAIVNLFFAPFAPPSATSTLSQPGSSYRQTHTHNFWGAGALFVQIVQPKSKQETLFWTTCLSWSFMRPLKGSHRGEGLLHWRRQYIRVCHCVRVCVCVCALAGVKSAKSLWLKPPEFGNFLETDASKNNQRCREEGGVGGQLHLPARVDYFCGGAAKVLCAAHPCFTLPLPSKSAFNALASSLKIWLVNGPEGACGGKLAIALEAMRKLAR